MHFGASVVQNFNTLFFMLCWAQGGSEQMCDRTRYVELVFLHLMRYADHVLRSVVSGA
jgi:hypothetical protein